MGLAIEISFRLPGPGKFADSAKNATRPFPRGVFQPSAPWRSKALGKNAAASELTMEKAGEVLSLTVEAGW